MFPASSGTAGVPAYNSPVAGAVRESGRVEMARRRIENIRERLTNVLMTMGSELDRLTGPMAEKASGEKGTPPRPTGELFALDSEVDALELVLAYAENIAGRIRTV